MIRCSLLVNVLSYGQNPRPINYGMLSVKSNLIGKYPKESPSVTYKNVSTSMATKTVYSMRK